MKKAIFSRLDTPSLSVRGVKLFQGLLNRPEQEALLDALRAIIRVAPLFQPETSRGQKMSVRMTSAGDVGWVSDQSGYRYQAMHPGGMPWPDIPPEVLDIWDVVSGDLVRPDTCLINFYGEDAKMGMHQDRDEADLSHPVVSISLGDDALFRIGNTTRGGKTESIWLKSGDVLTLGGEARMLYHGIDRVRHGSSTLLPKGGRVNLTLRVAG